MKRIFTSVFICSMLLLVISCSSSNDSKNQSCDKKSKIISTEAYNNLTSNYFVITGVALNNDCLDVTISSSGCSGTTWQMNLFSSNNFPDSFPLQRNLKLQLDNPEACLAVVSKTVSFDLTPLRVSGQQEIRFNLEGWEQQIVYNY